MKIVKDCMKIGRWLKYDDETIRRLLEQLKKDCEIILKCL
jgi:hypothetical protein